MFQEKGYDEFLAEKIRRGEADIQAGRVYTLEEAKQRWEQNLSKKKQELEAREQELAYV